MAHKVSKTLTEHEARQILGVSEKASWEEIMKVLSYFSREHFPVFLATVAFTAPSRLSVAT
jgi:hypothetical protein